jgi:hypothetical protein
MENLIKQLTDLTPEQALELSETLAGVTLKAAQAKADKAMAETQMNQRAVTCKCGEPATVTRRVEWVQYEVRLGTVGHKGGYIVETDTYDVVTEPPSNDPVFKGAWFACQNGDCKEWTHVADNNIIEWE